VLLEAVAVLSYQGPRADKARHLPACGYLSRFEPERSLEISPYLGDPLGNDQPMAQGSRFAFCQRSMGTYPLPGYGSVALGNRLVRTRMPGGVGAGGEIPPATRLDKPGGHYRKELFGAEGVESGVGVAGRLKRLLFCSLMWILWLHHSVFQWFSAFFRHRCPVPVQTGFCPQQCRGFLLHTRSLRLAYGCPATARVGGRTSLVAMITMAAPQVGQGIDGRGFRLSARVRQGGMRKTSCRKWISFLLHA